MRSLDLEDRKLPADGEQRDAFLSLYLSGIPSALLLSFPPAYSPPLTSDVPVCLSVLVLVVILAW